MLATYEDRLRTDRGFARRELEGYFGARGRIFAVLERLREQLSPLGVEFALCGDFAMCEHGCFIAHPQVEILVRKEDLPLYRSTLTGLRYRPTTENRTTFADTASEIRLRLHVAEVATPIEATVLDGIPVLALPRLIEMKLSAAMTNPRHMKDLVDIQELVQVLSLDVAMADRLEASVRTLFLDLCASSSMMTV